VLDYRREQQVKMANYIARDVATAPPHVGDGGTNPVFAGTMFPSSKYDGAVFQVASTSSVPGALPRVPNPPGTTIPKVGRPPAAAAKKPQPAAQPEPVSQPVVMASVPVPEPAPLPKEGQVPQAKPTKPARQHIRRPGREKRNPRRGRHAAGKRADDGKRADRFARHQYRDGGQAQGQAHARRSCADGLGADRAPSQAAQGRAAQAHGGGA
jgi:hypothetical protein